MNICFDLRALQIGHEKRGIGMYIKSVLEHLPKDDNKYVFYFFDRSNPIKEPNIKLDIDYEIISTPTIKTAMNRPSDAINVLKLICHRFNELRSKQIDVFVQFDFMLGIPRMSNTKNVVIAYDLIPLIKKNEYLPSPRFAWKHSVGSKPKIKAVLRSLYYVGRYKLQYKIYKRADKIIAISEATKKSFVDLLHVDESKITAIPLAPVISNTNQDESIAKKIGKPYLFYVGGTDSRKRIQDIVFAFNIARGRRIDIALVLAGNEFNHVEKIPSVGGRNAIIASPYKNDIHLVGFITEAQKLSLYKNALAFVFCSEYEGFGLPILEAMSVSCPVISYNNSSVPEISGSSALLVDTRDYVAVAKNIIKLKDTIYRNSIVELGKKQAAKYSWQKHGTEFVKVLLG